MAPPEAVPQAPEAAGDTASAVLEARSVSKRFPGVVALDDVSFSLRAGETHALVGENGAGKSTLIKVLTGVYRPDGGELRMTGEPVRFARPFEAQQAGISTIYQEVNLVPLMSVARNIFLGREPRNRFKLIDFARMHRETSELLDGFGVRVDPRRPLHTLGVGTQQMVALARAVSVNARVVIMDEPTSSLEPREVETLFRVIGNLRDKGIAVLYVSHRMDELYRICDRVTVLRDGRHIHTGDLADLDRMQLVSMMLGRDLSEVRRSGVTSFAAEGHEAARTPVLTATGLSSRLQLHDISLSLHGGEVLGLGGLLGSGRSETAKALSGALPLDAGELTVDGTTLKRLTPAAAIRAGISLLPEDRKAEGIVPGLSVRENIVLAAMPRLSRAGVVSRARQDRIVDIFMKRLRIKASSPEQKVGELSGGNQQKVLLARWLCLEPKVLLLDEPTRGIDVGAKAEVQSLIDDLAGEGLAVLLISSDIEELIEGADRIVVLRGGAVAGELTGDDVAEARLLEVLADHAPEPVGPAPAAQEDPDDPDRRRPVREERQAPEVREPACPAARPLLVPALRRLRRRRGGPALQRAVHRTLHDRGQLPYPARPGRPDRHRRPGHGPGHRHRGRRPLRRLDHGARRSLPPALPRLRARTRAHRLPPGGRRRRSRQRRPRLPRRAAAHRGHARALRRRPRTRPRHGRRPAQADRQPRPAVARHRLLPRHSARRLDRRSPRRRRGVPGAAHHLRPAGRRRRRQPFRRRARRAPRQAGPHRRVRDLRGARRARRHPRHRPAHRERPVLARHPHGTLRHHGGRRRRHPLNGGSVRVLGTVAGALLMQLLRATLVKHDLPDSTAQIAQAAIIIAAVYVARERRSR